MAVQVFQPFEIFYDINGRPLDDGFIWIGQPNLDPETNQISVFFDEAMTIPATQPVRTRNGFPANSGVPAQIFVSETTFSITIKNKNSTIIRSVAAVHSATDLEARLRDAVNPLNGAEIVGMLGGGTVAQAMPMVSVAQFGADGSGNETTALTSACTQAVAAGHKRVFIPFATFTATNGTDCQGCELYGADTVLTGRLSNHVGLFNIRVLNQNQSLSTKSPERYTDRTNKLLWRFSSTLDYCLVQKARGYALLGFVINSTTTSESLATTNTDPTRRRFSEALDVIWAGVYKHTFSAESGTWTSVNIPQPVNIIPTFTGGRSITSRFTTTNGDYAEYVLFPYKGMVQFAILAGTTSVETATVHINGVLAATIATPAAASNTIKVFSIPALGNPDSQTVTLRLTHTGSAGKRLQIIGANFYELKDWDGQESTHFGYFRNSANADYLTQSSANDAVIRETNSNLYGLSYHGGETNIVSDWYVNHVITSPAIDGYAVSKDIVHLNSCDVSWGAFGGGQISIKATYTPKYEGLSHVAQIVGDVTVGEVYTHMFGTPGSFTEVTSPAQIDLTASADNSRNPVGRTNSVSVRNPTTGQEIRASLTLYEREQNQYGGLHFWKVIGSYNKMYYGPCLGGRMRITNLSLHSDYSFW